MEIYRLDETARFIGTFRPRRLLPQFMESIIGRSMGNNEWSVIESIQVGEVDIPMIDISTTSGTFIANGLISHNSQAMNIKKVREVKEGRDDFFAKMDAQMLAYSKSAQNISKLSTFLYNQAMEKVYQLCYQSLPIGGSLSIIIKDRINNGKRTYLSKWVERVCMQAGFSKLDWFKWAAPGTSFTNVRRSRGEEVVDDEDIMIFWRLK